MTARPWLLLTGATGLLGGFLLRDMLAMGWRVAVLARANRRETAVQRVERVLANLERINEVRLPRPRVIEGAIHGDPESVSVSSEDLRWVRQHVGQLIHSAASVTFQGRSDNGEPFRTNVGGVLALLAFCRSAGIPVFHHVSTAYVCGDREGAVRESELDCGQSHSNDYEKSKFMAEKLLQGAAPEFEQITIFRPSIIVGEMATGYTATFHGFYTPLKILGLQLQAGGVTGVTAERFWTALGFVGHESKNLVPADWVSAAMLRVVGDSSLHGQTYHLTTGHPTPVSLLGDVFGALLAGLEGAEGPRVSADPNLTMALVESFVEQMSVYRAYWKNDPEFARDNLSKAVPDLPAPKLSRHTLMRLGGWALRNGFRLSS